MPEPELGLVLGDAGEPVAVTIGNDVSSRDIEGENPLYIPQAKIFAGACAIGPVLAVPDDWDAPFAISMRITAADGAELFAGETSTARMKRSLAELAGWLLRDNPVPPGSVLLTGTGLVPPDDYTLTPGHIVEIEIPGIGVLVNTVAGPGSLTRDRDRHIEPMNRSRNDRARRGAGAPGRPELRRWGVGSVRLGRDVLEDQPDAAHRDDGGVHVVERG